MLLEEYQLKYCYLLSTKFINQNMYNVDKNLPSRIESLKILISALM